MGLSLKNLGKKIWDQVDPLDNGRTFKNPQGNGQNQSALHQATHNGATNFVGNNLVKPLAQAPVDASAQLYSHIVAPTFNLPNLKQGQPSLNPAVQGVASKIGATGSLHQTLASGAQLGLTIGTGGVGDLIEGGAARALPAAIPKVVPKVINSSAQGAAFNAAAAAGQGQKPGEILKSGAEGAALGSVIPAVVPAAKVVAKVVPSTVERAATAIKNYSPPEIVQHYQSALTPKETVPGSSFPAKVEPTPVPAAPAPSVTPKILKAQAAPEGAVLAPKVAKASTSVPEINKAIDNVATNYSTSGKFTGGLQDIIKQATGKSQLGLRNANALRKALTDNLSEAENKQVSDVLDNHPTEATPKAIEVAKALKPLQDQGFAIRKVINPEINQVKDYVSRIPSKSIAAKTTSAGEVLGKIHNLADITNLRSAFSQSRKIGKFVDDKGNAVYGDPAKLGIISHQDGTFSNGKGTNFTQQAVSKRELEANGAGKYEHNISRISGIYHGDTASLKARAEALQALKAAPENFGLHDVSTAPEGSVPVTKVQELQGLYGAPKDVKALEDSFGYKSASGPIGKAYDAISNVATQAIVLNPFFHGMNQLYQSGIAAGNIPGADTGFLKLARGVMGASEADIKDFLENGGHSPTYGANQENTLSHITGGLTKANSHAMAAIELKLRAGLYKASVEGGMTPKAAVDNIDRFLGDAHGVGTTARRFTLFYHYFRTMGGAIKEQATHPLEQKGSILNTAALAALTAAVSYGYQKATGNQNAYVRMPGELSLIKEGVTSAEGVAQGDPGKAAELVTNRVNPVLKEGLQQAFNKDLFTGQPVTDTGRVAHAVNATIAPAQTIGRAASGKKSAEETATNQLGLYTPHAKGYQASSKVPALNTKGSIAGNGVAAQTAYFTGIDKLHSELGGDGKATAALNDYLARSKDPNTGQTIQNSPSESIQNSSALFANDKLRSAVQTFEKSQPNHDPMWDLPADKLKTYMDYKEQYTGDAAKKFIMNQNPWIKDTIAKTEDFYNKLQYPGGSKTPLASKQTPPYPKFDPATQKLLDQYDAASDDQKTALIKSNGGDLSSAWNTVAQWTNKMRAAEGAPEQKDYPVADAGTQKVIDAYNAIPKGTGARSAYIKANPEAYKKMTDYLTQASMNTLVKNAALDQFKGSDPNQDLLKSIKNIGQYDIGQQANGQYALAGSGSPITTSGSNSSSKSYASSNAAYKDSKYLSNTSKYRVTYKGTKQKKAKVAVKKGLSGSKVASSGGKTKVSLKHSLV